MTKATSVTALSASRTRIATVKSQVLTIIESAGVHGCISDEIVKYFPSSLKTGTINTRYSELEREGLIFRAGDTRPGKSGCQQTVWRSCAWKPLVRATAAPKPKKKTGFMAGLVYAAKIAMAADPTFKGSPAAIALKAAIKNEKDKKHE